MTLRPRGTCPQATSVLALCNPGLPSAHPASHLSFRAWGRTVTAKVLFLKENNKDDLLFSSFWRKTTGMIFYFPLIRLLYPALPEEGLSTLCPAVSSLHGPSRNVSRHPLHLNDPIPHSLAPTLPRGCHMSHCHATCCQPIPSLLLTAHLPSMAPTALLFFCCSCPAPSPVRAVTNPCHLLPVGRWRPYGYTHSTEKPALFPSGQP